MHNRHGETHLGGIKNILRRKDRNRDRDKEGGREGKAGKGKNRTGLKLVSFQ